MRKSVSIVFATIIAFLLYAQAASAASAASLKFNSTTYSGAVGGTVKVDVIVNPGTDSISGVDAHVTYDATVLQAQSVTAGTYFPAVNESIASGKVSIYASVTDPASSKTGEGTIASITFVVLKNGSSNLQFYCDSATYNSSKVVKNDINATNIIVCSQNGSAVVTGGTGGTSGNPQITPTPVTQLPAAGTVENISFVAIIGVALIALGGIVKFLH